MYDPNLTAGRTKLWFEPIPEEISFDDAELLEDIILDIENVHAVSMYYGGYVEIEHSTHKELDIAVENVTNLMKDFVNRRLTN